LSAPPSAIFPESVDTSIALLFGKGAPFAQGRFVRMVLLVRKAMVQVDFSGLAPDAGAAPGRRRRVLAIVAGVLRVPVVGAILLPRFSANL